MPKWYLVSDAEERVFTNDYRDAVQMAEFLKVNPNDILEVDEPPDYAKSKLLANTHKVTVTVRYRPLSILLVLFLTSGIAYGVLKLIAWIGMNFS